jgi:hypothetical protein
MNGREWKPAVKRRLRPDRLFLFCLSAFLLLALGCGRKAAPVPPIVVVPPPVNDLKAEVIDGRLMLTWSIPTKDGRAVGGITGFRVFKYQAQNDGALCPGCPMPFEEFVEIELKKPQPARVEGTRVLLEDRFDPAYPCVYKVVAYHKSGGVSEDSNVANVPLRIGGDTGGNQQ